MEGKMVRILPALVGAVALGAASVIRHKKRASQKKAQPRTKQAAVKRTRKTSARRKSR
jgi:uncharacterized protein HemX